MMIEILNKCYKDDRTNLTIRFLEKAEFMDGLRVYTIKDYSMPMHLELTEDDNILTLLNDNYNVIEILDRASGIWVRYMSHRPEYLPMHIFYYHHNKWAAGKEEKGARELMKLYDEKFREEAKEDGD